MSRRVIVGAIGGDGQKSIGLEFGAAVARAGYILLTGGQVKDSDEIKDAVMVGGEQAEGGDAVARLIGILPGGPIDWDTRLDKRLFLHTGLPHYVRNVINGRTPDVVVVFGGSRGTLAEAAFARAAGKQLFFCGAVARLKSNLEKYFTHASGEDFDTYFRKPLMTYPEAVGTALTAEGLVTLLAQTLERASDSHGSIATLVANAANRIAASTTGFPGLPGEPISKKKFEDIVAQLSL